MLQLYALLRNIFNDVSPTNGKHHVFDCLVRDCLLETTMCPDAEVLVDKEISVSCLHILSSQYTSVVQTFNQYYSHRRRIMAAPHDQIGFLRAVVNALDFRQPSPSRPRALSAPAPPLPAIPAIPIPAIPIPAQAPALPASAPLAQVPPIQVPPAQPDGPPLDPHDPEGKFMQGWHGNPMIDKSHEWLPVKHLGSGGEGSAALWVRRNRNGVIMDRMVVKTVPGNERSHGQLNGSHPWAYFFQLRRHRNLGHGKIPAIPREAYIHRLLTRKKTYSIVQYRGSAKYFEQKAYKGYRVYTDFCPYGSLYDAIYLYCMTETSWPESFIWYTFLRLAEACVRMEGPLIHFSHPHGREVIHQDLKTTNIFIDVPPTGQDAGFQNWPLPKVADFGASRHTSSEDPENSDFFEHDPHTLGTLPREQFNQYWEFGPGQDDINGVPYGVPGPEDRADGEPDPNQPPLKRSSSMNVFQAGMVIRSMIRDGLDGHIQPDYRFARFRKIDCDALYAPDVPRSRELIQLVEKCVMYHQQDRITAKELLKELKDPRKMVQRFENSHMPYHREGGYNTRARARDAAAARPPRFPQDVSPPHLPFEPPADEYATGLSLRLPQDPMPPGAIRLQRSHRPPYFHPWRTGSRRRAPRRFRPSA